MDYFIDNENYNTLNGAYSILEGIINPSEPPPPPPPPPPSSGGPLRVHSGNRRYVTDNSGKPIYLAGVSTWNEYQIYPKYAGELDYTTYLDYLVQYDMNTTKFRIWESMASTPSSHLPYARTGPGLAIDGLPKFDLYKYNQGFFDRLRQRVILAGQRGIYVSVSLFHWREEKGGTNPHFQYKDHPYHPNNNINGVNPDSNNDGYGLELQTLDNPSVTNVQKAYIRKVIDTLNDLDNVYWEFAIEGQINSVMWQYTLIEYIHSYESTKPKQHLVTMRGGGSQVNNDILRQSPADIIAPGHSWGTSDFNKAATDPIDEQGKKISISDVDNYDWWSDSAGVSTWWFPTWPWKNFTRGVHVLPLEAPPTYIRNGNTTSYKTHGGDMPEYQKMRSNFKYMREYSQRIDLVNMVPRSDLCSSGYCLAYPNNQYLAYLPNGGTVSLNLTGAAGTFRVEWLNTSNGAKIPAQNVSGGGSRSFTTPFSGDGVLYIYK